MYKSPLAPSGTGLRFASNTYTVVFAIGHPIDIRASSLISSTVDQIVVSVGPYTFQRSPRGRSLEATSLVNASPPHNIFKRPISPHPLDSNITHVAGVACTIVAPLLSRSEEHTSELQSRLHLVCRL